MGFSILKVDVVINRSQLIALLIDDDKIMIDTPEGNLIHLDQARSQRRSIRTGEGCWSIHFSLKWN